MIAAFPTWMLSTGIGGGGDVDNTDWESLVHMNPRHRVGTPEDIAGLAIFLSSRAGAFTVGEIITCDGGAVNQGANPMTFLGLAGVGDLIVTCSSPKSRNYQVGFALGQGLSLEDAVTRLGEVAEGVNTLKVLKAKAQELNVYMPLVAGLHAILFEGYTLEQVIGQLMRGEPKTDVDFISTSGFN